MRHLAYQCYKPSGVEWLGDVPEHWEVKRLRYLAQLRNDKTEADEETRLPYVGMEHIESWTGRLLPPNGEIVPTGISNRFRAGALLFGKLRPYLAKACIVDFNGLCSSELLVLESRQQNRRFFLYQLLSDGFVSLVDSSTYGAKMPRASWDFIGHCQLPVPPDLEQRAIAHFLDRETAKLDMLLGTKQQLIEKLKEKRTALISRTVTRGLPPDAARAAGLNPLPNFKFSGIEWLGDIPQHWDVRQLRRSLVGIRNGTSATQEEQEEGYVPVTRIETISNGVIDFSKVGYVQKTPALRDYRLNEGDILFSHINSLAMIGNCAIYDDKLELYSGMNLLRLQPCRGVDAHWLWRYLSSDPFRKNVSARAKPAINQASLTTSQLKQMPIPIPPPPEQHAIADYLDRETAKIDRMVEKVEEAIERLQEYRTALITAAVTGKIDVRTKH